jgi:hypothetical protein
VSLTASSSAEMKSSKNLLNFLFNQGFPLQASIPNHDPVVQRLKLARNRGVFHFDAEEFKLRARRSLSQECSFTAGKGRLNKDVYNPFAGALVIDMFLRLPDDPTLTAEQLASRENAEACKRVPEVRDLALKFSELAEGFISESLKNWGFVLKDNTVLQV